MSGVYFLQASRDERWAWATGFTESECKSIIEYGKSLDLQPASVEGVNENFSIRKSAISWIYYNKDSDWIYSKCADMVSRLNQEFFNYDLTFIEALQFTEYKDDGEHYGKHIDTKYYGHGGIRKLSFSVLLSDENSYSGGDLVLHFDGTPPPSKRQRGTMIAFASNTLHEVTPVTSGVRYSLVGWVNGPNWK